MIGHTIERMTTINTHTHIPEITMRHRLRIAREDAQLDQATLAEIMGVSRNTISSAEHGHTIPRRIVLNAWAHACYVPVTWLETGKDPHPDDDPNGGQTVRHERLELSTRWLNACAA